ncbi:J domain-containing protein [Arthrobacter sp. 2MCAF15]|uniref:J domain-containing protein n=1 Tax=Arthrobacter sp. 2MCAF15 TaxID=3232984 RepID=UPI003F911FCE
MREHRPDPYEVLHLGRAATAPEVTRAYRALVRTRHPDTRPADAGHADPNATAHERQELQEVMDAYAILGDPAKRAAYDRQRSKTPPPEPAPPHRDPGPFGPDLIIGPLRWETPIPPAPGPQDLWWISL